MNFGIDLATSVNRVLKLPDELKTWIVFGLCFICNLVGVLVSLQFLSVELKTVSSWVVGPIISVGAMLAGYTLKYGDEKLRKIFTPLDLLQFTLQGFLWSSSWPTLADAFGIENPIGPPEPTTLLLFALQALRFVI